MSKDDETTSTSNDKPKDTNTSTSKTTSVKKNNLLLQSFIVNTPTTMHLTFKWLKRHKLTMVVVGTTLVEVLHHQL